MIAIRILFRLIFILAPVAPGLAMDDLTPEPGLRYRVSGVAEGDRLNVRSRPGTDADIIGSFRPDEGNIVATGAREEIGGAIWWELAYPGAERGTGWVKARLLTRETTIAAEDTNYPLECVGTEPFWSLAIDTNRARYSLAEDERTFDASPWVGASGLRGHFVVRLLEPGRTTGAQGLVVVMRDYDFCSDGMSEIDYPFHGTIILPDGGVYGGCCRRAAR